MLDSFVFNSWFASSASAIWSSRAEVSLRCSVDRFILNCFKRSISTLSICCERSTFSAFAIYCAICNLSVSFSARCAILVWLRMLTHWTISDFRLSLSAWWACLAAYSESAYWAISNLWASLSTWRAYLIDSMLAMDILASCYRLSAIFLCSASAWSFNCWISVFAWTSVV